MFGYICQQMLKVLIWLQLVCLCRFSYTVDDCRTGRTIDRVYYFPVFLTDTETTDSPLAGIVIHWHITLFEKYSQITFLIQCISKSISHFSTFSRPARNLFQVRKESIQPPICRFHGYFANILSFLSSLYLLKIFLIGSMTSCFSSSFIPKKYIESPYTAA